MPARPRVLTRSFGIVLCCCAFVAGSIAACSAPPPQEVAFQATLPLLTVTAPVYTVTPTRTPIPTETNTATATHTSTVTLTATVTATFTETAVPTDTASPTWTLVPSDTALPTEIAPDAAILAATKMPTLAVTAAASELSLNTPDNAPNAMPTFAGSLITLTPALPFGAPAADERGAAGLSAVTGWTCDDFPCADDIEGFLERIQVPSGYTVEAVGRFPGQVMQIAYGGDGRLYATVLENGTQNGAVYVLTSEGETSRYSGDLISPLGLAFQPGTNTLYVSARQTALSGTGIWRIAEGGGDPQPLISDLPCCFAAVDNQANGITFGRDGHLYVGVGALTDRGVNPPRSEREYPEIVPYEASVLRIQPLTGEVQVVAQGIRNPFDLGQDSVGRWYTTDTGTLGGSGDRILRLEPNGHYGFPYWRGRGCDDCPIKPASVTVAPDLLALPAYTLPRGLVVYTGIQFPINMFDQVFVAFWNNTEGGQRIVRIEPRAAADESYVPEAFMTGLIRPVDVVIAPDGSLVVADYVYGHIWRVRYTG